MIDKIKHYPLGEKGVMVVWEKRYFNYYIIHIDFDNKRLVLNRHYNDYFSYSNTELDKIKPILKPLSSLEYELTEISQAVKYSLKDKNNYIQAIQFGYVEWLLDNFFDIFDLIESGQAIAYDPAKHNNCYV